MENNLLPEEKEAPKKRLRASLSRAFARYRAYRHADLLSCFLLPFLLMLLIYAVIQVFPFGRGSVLVLDLNGQYVYFFEALRDAVWGDTSLLYSFSRALGGEFLGIYAYYLASPLSYIVALFPKKWILEALFLMFLIKCGLSGLSFGYFLKKTSTVSKRTMILFSATYALSSYAVVMQHNTMWTDNMILLPMIALGIRELVHERKYKRYVASLSLAILSNFYIGYMSCIFSVLYFFYVWIGSEREETNPRGSLLAFPASALRFGASSLLAGGIGSLIVIPALYSLTFGKNTFSTPTYEFTSKLDLFDTLTKLLFGSYDTVRPEGLPMIYCGILTLLLIPFYLCSSKIKKREKGANILLCLVLLFSFSIHLLDLAWHGFQVPNWLNYRYAYMLVFLLVGMAAKGFDSIREHRPSAVMLTALPPGLFLIIAEYFSYKHLETFFFPIFETLLCLAVYGVALTQIIKRKEMPRSFATGCLMIIVSLELVLAGIQNLGQLHLDVVISSRNSYLGYQERFEDAFDAAKADAEEEGLLFYRMEKLHYRKVNDPYLFDYRGLSGSTSTLNRQTVEFLNSMGYLSASHASRYNGTNPFTDSFLSVSYVAAEEKTPLPDRYLPVYDNGDVKIYENPDALPPVFGVSSTINDITLITPKRDQFGDLIDPEDDRRVCDYRSPFERMNALASALLGEDVRLFVPIIHTYQGENMSHAYVSSFYQPIDPSKDSFAHFTVTVPQNAELYAYFPSERTTGADYFLNGEEIGVYFTGESFGYLSLGRYEAGEQATVSFKPTKDGFYVYRSVNCFFYLDDTVYERLMETLHESAYEIETFTEDSFQGKISVKEGQNTILTTIPYDEGWRVSANGEEIETYITLDALLAFDLPTGDYELSLVYRPSCYTYALIIFSASAGIFLLLIGLGHIIKRNNKRKETEQQKAAKTAGKDEVCPSSTTSEES